MDCMALVTSYPLLSISFMRSEQAWLYSLPPLSALPSYENGWKLPFWERERNIHTYIHTVRYTNIDSNLSLKLFPWRWYGDFICIYFYRYRWRLNIILYLSQIISIHISDSYLAKELKIYKEKLKLGMNVNMMSVSIFGNYFCYHTGAP